MNVLCFGKKGALFAAAGSVVAEGQKVVRVWLKHFVPPKITIVGHFPTIVLRSELLPAIERKLVRSQGYCCIMITPLAGFALLFWTRHITFTKPTIQSRVNFFRLLALSQSQK